MSTPGESMTFPSATPDKGRGPATGLTVKIGLVQINNSFLRANRQIDIAVHNEDERTFLKLLDTYPDRTAWETLTIGVQYLGGNTHLSGRRHAEAS